MFVLGMCEVSSLVARTAGERYYIDHCSSIHFREAESAEGANKALPCFPEADNVLQGNYALIPSHILDKCAFILADGSGIVYTGVSTAQYGTLGFMRCT